MKKTKTQKGITLIALIITIVVLLVLASVAIAAIQNNDLIWHTQNAVGLHEQAQQDEQDVLDHYELILAKKDWKQIEEDGKIMVVRGDQKLEVGTYVNYDPVTGVVDTTKLSYTALKAQTGSNFDFYYDAQTAKNAGLKWKILGAEHGKLLLVSNAVVSNWDGTLNDDTVVNFVNDPNPALQLKADGVGSGLKIMQNIANIYSHGVGADEARFFNMSDLNRLTGINPGYNEKGEKWQEGKTYEYGIETSITLTEGNVLKYSNKNGSGEVDLDNLSDYEDGKFRYYNGGGEYVELKMGETITLRNTYYSYTYGTGNDSIVYKLLATGDGNNTYRIILGDQMQMFQGEGNSNFVGYYRMPRCHFNDAKDSGYRTGTVTLMYTHGPVSDSSYAFNPFRIVVELGGNANLTETSEGSGVYNITLNTEN